MAKTVVLARPHPFLVNDMRPWLDGIGYSVTKPERAEDLTTLARGCTAAVVSLALSSPTGMSAEEVLRVLKKEAPNARLLFASLLPFDKAAPALEKLAGQMGVQAVLINLGDPAGLQTQLLGRGTTFAYLAKDDLADSVRRTHASRLLLQHFV